MCGIYIFNRIKIMPLWVIEGVIVCNCLLFITINSLAKTQLHKIITAISFQNIRESRRPKQTDKQKATHNLVISDAARL